MKKNNIDDWIKKRKERLKGSSPSELFDGIRDGNITSLSSAITLIESQNVSHRSDSNELVNKCLPYSGNSIRIGITGVPGVGKSTFIESFGKVLLANGKKIAVLAVDPSSSISGGSILGDKTRMHVLSAEKNVFIRPSPAGDTLGGVTRKTRETILLCEAAGFDIVLIETVGVGQSETLVKSMVDFFLLLMLSGAGDELQGIKKGIMEMADALIITKSDGENIQRAKLAAREYKNAMHLFPPNKNNWIPKVAVCSSIENSGIENVYNIVEEFKSQVYENGSFQKNRINQNKRWLTDTLKEMLLNDFFSDGNMLAELKRLEKKVEKNEISSFEAAEKIYQFYRNEGRV